MPWRGALNHSVPLLYYYKVFNVDCINMYLTGHVSYCWPFGPEELSNLLLLVCSYNPFHVSSWTVKLN